MVVQSALLKREGFAHGFGTRRSIPDDFPMDAHILLQVHGEKIVVLTEHAVRRTQYAGENLNKGAESRQPQSSGIWNLESLSDVADRKALAKADGIAGSNLDVKFMELPADPFRFDSGDAMVSDIPGVTMGIRTADCLPLLIVERVRGTAAAVHCGWRSLALGLAGKVVTVMGEIMGSRRENLLAAIGPSIGPCCYEVGEDVREAFPADQRGEGLFLHRGRKMYLDLASGVKTQIINAGINPESVDEIVACTSCSPDRFWSWRARKEEERMVSFITVREEYSY